MHVSMQWKMELELDRKLDFPYGESSSNTRPEMVIWAQRENIVTVELTGTGRRLR